MWIWDQSNGMLMRDGQHVAFGYSGSEWGKNNPAAQSVPGIGPIPQGLWKIVAVENSPHTGPYTLVLEPSETTDVEGRSAFRIHGDSIANPGTASHGCIILPRTVRQAIWESIDHTLCVEA